MRRAGWNRWEDACYAVILLALLVIGVEAIRYSMGYESRCQEACFVQRGGQYRVLAVLRAPRRCLCVVTPGTPALSLDVEER